MNFKRKLVYCLVWVVAINAHANNSCLKVYKEQKNALKKEIAYYSAIAPFTDGLIKGASGLLYLAGMGFVMGLGEFVSDESDDARKAKFHPLVGSAATAFMTAGGALGGALYSAYCLGNACIVSPFYRMPRSIYYKIHVDQIYQLLKEVHSLLELNGNDGNLKFSSSLNKLYIDINKDVKRENEKKISKKELLEKIQYLSENRDLCPDGNVYTDEKIFSEIIKNSYLFPYYSISEEIYNKAKFFQGPYKRWFNKEAKEEFKARNSKIH